ncbi:MAG TPA: DNA adenine methylase [Fimbriimonadaceae bacterium]|nr:DNA adenine methylase [Fimbriimonadaceae bacterium]
MKYMGSKRTMLEGSLGNILESNRPKEGIFADLFAGSGAVAWHMAEICKARVLAVDKQCYAKALAGAVLHRTRALRSASALWDEWARQSHRWLASAADFAEAQALQAADWDGRPELSVVAARKFCKASDLPITAGYGGHYFSAWQSLCLDALRTTAPIDAEVGDTYVAAVVIAAAECAAAPGHTAQPFQPTTTASKYLFEAWRRDVFAHARRAFVGVASRHAVKQGASEVGDATEFAERLTAKDVAFIDPPYSGVQYSRFYHVLETVASGCKLQPEGVGRYPAHHERPQSDFSLKSKSLDAFTTLAKTIADRGARCILTYPSGQCSNGLSGESVLDVMATFFEIEIVTNRSIFSTLGGNGGTREARQRVQELIVVGAAKG